MPLPDGIQALLLDIEGTTTPIAFVYEVLFPFARERLVSACAETPADPPVAAALGLLRKEHARESKRATEDLPEFGTGAPYAAYLMDRDRKSTGLKRLQGILWEEGYRSGELHGEVFADVAPALEEWRRRGIRMRIFSSGSVLAQRLLFSHCREGDLTSYFEGFHDTTTGPKKEASSYRAIAAAFNLAPERILFLSDVVAELDAAAAAGMTTGLIVRPGNPPAPSADHPTYGSFDKLV